MVALIWSCGCGRVFCGFGGGEGAVAVGVGVEARGRDGEKLARVEAVAGQGGLEEGEGACG